VNRKRIPGRARSTNANTPQKISEAATYIHLRDGCPERIIDDKSQRINRFLWAPTSTDENRSMRSSNWSAGRFAIPGGLAAVRKLAVRRIPTLPLSI
jgi:hypothetical protein